MLNVYRKTSFTQKHIYIWSKHGFTTHTKKTESKLHSMKWVYTDSQEKKKVLGAPVSKEGNSDSVLGHEKTHHD